MILNHRHLYYVLVPIMIMIPNSDFEIPVVQCLHLHILNTKL